MSTEENEVADGHLGSCLLLAVLAFLVLTNRQRYSAAALLAQGGDA